MFSNKEFKEAVEINEIDVKSPTALTLEGSMSVEDIKKAFEDAYEEISSTSRK